MIQQAPDIPALRGRTFWFGAGLGLVLLALVGVTIVLVIRGQRSASRVPGMLRVKSGPAANAQVQLGPQAFAIGRAAENDLVLSGDLVSRSHARIVREGGAYTIEDLASTTGTFVNHQRVARAVLHDGDEIGIGETLMVFRAPSRGDQPHA